ncbi:TetR/AcrR family transcriptional regulator [Enterobacteriaceae bacterium H4N4]|uniref:TetR/AcrR family transcriptional regulator n=1 Tax=Silvania confinis TaxID=2926470 RepID=A0A9J6QQH7_9ENTR|nr:TetR/AcrR family transcriptional regulator [Silvania confinis]MCU6671634.1 TetR/AcrR family transcriptional regulator [Silvania confinis]
MKEAKETLKARILDGAIALFLEKGIANVTTRELTESLGISRSHTYHYFSNWQVLCIAALDRYMRDELQTFSQQIAALTSVQKMEQLIENFLPLEPDAAWQLYSSTWQLAIHNAAYAELVEGITEEWSGVVCAIIEEGINNGAFRDSDARRTTRQLVALLNGYAELLSVRPTAEKCQMVEDDIADFVQRFVYKALCSSE